jgi:uncharacterized protein YjbI with pentapeptide repeats
MHVHFTVSLQVFTRSDLSRADIYGADFSNALLDKSMQMQLCRYADGVNPQTVRLALVL